ncbi:mevalonate kinase [Kitasatospora sp. NPDC059327]|uniref:mevalonate kinase n=1 Tax=Kitasatospora sp. NPDC059327 TaxID=3346803 RepID=UPI0036AED88E
MNAPTSAERSSGIHPTRSVGTGRAHAKVILLGEHAVVYGAPALALPVPQLLVTASAGWASRACDDLNDVSFTATGSAPSPVVPPARDGLRRLAAAYKATAGVGRGPGLDVVIDGSIPPGRGLGSSAAYARAVVLALADLFGRELTESEAFDLVQTAETATHGRSSGVDARAVGAAAPLRFQDGRVQELSVGCDGLLVIADSGVMGGTKDAVELLGEVFRRRAGTRQGFVDRASRLTDEAGLALAAGAAERFGARLTEYHELLSSTGLSTRRIDAMVGAALTAGSLGAKLTGGGLGGCVIALTRPEHARQVIRRLNESGAVHTWAVPLRGSGDHVS